MSAPDTLKLISIADLSPIDSVFGDLTSVDGIPVEWKRRSGLPATALEQLITRPRLSRYRGAWQAIQDARDASAVISHAPRMSAAVANLARLRKRNIPHLAFAFNFTDIPGTTGRKYFSYSLGDVARFATFTRFEADLYADAFSLPRSRFVPVTWAQDKPSIIPVESGQVPDRPFVVAIGGEGRDYGTLMSAARALPDLRFVVIARPVAALENAPSNVTVMYNVPYHICWGVAAKAAALLIPLMTDETCCGHITLVSGRMLGIPIVTTASRGTSEYTDDFAGTTLVAAGDVDAWISSVKESVQDAAVFKDAASNDMHVAESTYDKKHWARYIEDFVRSSDL